MSAILAFVEATGEALVEVMVPLAVIAAAITAGLITARRGFSKSCSY